MLHQREREHTQSGCRGISTESESIIEYFEISHKLEGTARLAGLLLAPAEGGQKRAFHAVCANFRPFLVFSSNPHNIK